MFMSGAIYDSFIEADEKSKPASKVKESTKPKRRESSRSTISLTRSLKHGKSTVELPAPHGAQELSSNQDILFELPADYQQAHLKSARPSVSETPISPTSPASPAGSSNTSITSPRFSTLSVLPAYEAHIPFSVGNTKESYMTLGEQEQAIVLLKSRRNIEDQPKFKSRWKRAIASTKKSEITPFTEKEINRAIHDLLDDRSISIGLVEALLSLRRDVGMLQRQDSTLTRTSSNTTTNEPEITPIDLLSKATRHQRSELVAFLALRSESDALDAALPFALDRGDPHILTALLNCGANANVSSCHEKFRWALARGDDKISQSLLHAKKPPSAATCSSGLVLAVNKGSSETLRLLLACGADADFAEAEALTLAIELLDETACTKLARAAKSPSPQSLENGVRLLSEMNVPDQKLRYVILKALLEGPGRGRGAKGQAVAHLLTTSIEQNNKAIVSLIVENLDSPRDLPDDFAGEDVIVHAARNGQVEVLRILTALAPSHDALDRAIPNAFKISHAETRLGVATALLEAGARGSHVAQALIDAVELINRDDVSSRDAALDAALAKKLVLDGKADVDFKNGHALKTAIKHSNTEIVDLILQKKPSPTTLATALPTAIEAQRLLKDPKVISTLLKYVNDNSSIEEALVRAISSSEVDSELVEVLLTKAKSIGVVGQEPLRAAAKAGDFDLLKILLGKRPDNESLSAALGAVHALARKKDLDIALYLLQQGARGPAAVDIVCVAGNLFDFGILKTICDAIGKDVGVFSAAFGEATGHGEQWLEPRNAEIIKTMLEHGASGEVVHLALIQALHAYRSGKELDHVIELLLANGASVNHENGECLQLAAEIGNKNLLEKLLSHRASGLSIMRSLSAALLAGHDEERLLDLLDSFAVVKASTIDLDFACPGMDPPIFLCVHAYPKSSKLIMKLRNMGCKLSTNVECEVYPDENQNFREELVDEIAQKQLGRNMEGQNANFKYIGWRNTQDNPCSHWSWDAYEDSHQRRMRGLGSFDDQNLDGVDTEEADVEAVGDSITALLRREERCITYFCLDCAESTGKTAASTPRFAVESVNILQWALIQHDRRVSSDVIMALLDCDVPTDAITPLTKATPLVLAARNNHHSVLAKLLERGAKINARDALDRTALSYASQFGHIGSIRCLLSHKARTNDGSLHEACRGYHSDVMEALIAAGHDPNYRCSRHNGRTALAELARKGRLSDDETQVEDAVEILVENSADALIISNGKTVLFHALDNPHALFITRILLERALWKTVADPANAWQRGDFMYSATQYVIRDIFQGDERDKWELFRMLKNHGAEDQYYATAGHPQPLDAINVPTNITTSLSPHQSRPDVARSPSGWRRTQRDERNQRYEREAGFQWERQQRQLQLAFLERMNGRQERSTSWEKTMTRFQRVRLVHMASGKSVTAVDAARMQRGMSQEEVKAKRMESVRQARSTAFRRFSR